MRKTTVKMNGWLPWLDDNGNRRSTVRVMSGMGSDTPPLRDRLAHPSSVSTSDSCTVCGLTGCMLRDVEYTMSGSPWNPITSTDTTDSSTARTSDAFTLARRDRRPKKWSANCRDGRTPTGMGAEDSSSRSLRSELKCSSPNTVNSWDWAAAAAPSADMVATGDTRRHGDTGTRYSEAAISNNCASKRLLFGGPRACARVSGFLLVDKGMEG